MRSPTMFLNLWRRMVKQHFRTFRPGNHASRRPKAATYKPRLEVFEDRTLLSTVNWIGWAGVWNDSTHWDTGHVPTMNDDAVMATGATVTVNDGTYSVQSLTVSSGTLALTSGGIAVSNGLTVNGTVQVGDSDGSTYGQLIFSNTQTIGGSGSIVLGSRSANEVGIRNEGTTVTLASTLTIHGKSGLFDTLGSATG